MRKTCRDCCVSGHTEHAHASRKRTYHCRCEARLRDMDVRAENIAQRACQSFKGGWVISQSHKVTENGKIGFNPEKKVSRSEWTRSFESNRMHVFPLTCAYNLSWTLFKINNVQVSKHYCFLVQSQNGYFMKRQSWKQSWQRNQPAQRNTALFLDRDRRAAQFNSIFTGWVIRITSKKTNKIITTCHL